MKDLRSAIRLAFFIESVLFTSLLHLDCISGFTLNSCDRSSAPLRLSVRTKVSEENVNDDDIPIIDAGDIEVTGGAIERLGSRSGPTVWAEFGRISNENNIVANLGQGFPDWLPPEFATDSLVEATVYSCHQPHQYTRTEGHPKLVEQLAKRYSTHLQQKIDPMSEVAVTVGASQALYLSLQALIKPGDEVVVFEPFFDLYVSQIKLAGGKPVFVPLKFVRYDEKKNGKGVNEDSAKIGNGGGGEWILEEDSVRKAITKKTKAIILNSPHNPTGKIFLRHEMQYISDAMTELADPNCVVLSDEVYKYIVHSTPNQPETSESTISSKEHSPLCPGHIHFASLPGMWDRTITISSAGKTFSATGWQVGWCIGPSKLLAPIHRIMPYVQFCASTIMQEALARALPRADEKYLEYENYYDYLKAKYTRKRDMLGNALKEAGFHIPDYSVTPGGGFFILAQIGDDLRENIPKDRLLPSSNAAAPGGIARQDWALCEWLAEEKGILCIPSSPFFSEERAIEGASDDFVRVAFCKTDETIEAAAEIFRNFRRNSRDNDVLETSGDSIAKSETLI